jgi:hypothetical protein
MNTAILSKTNHSAIISIMFNFRRIVMLGGILKSLVNPANLAMLAMGPGGIAAMAVKMLGTAIGQQIIQQLGKQLGLPPAITQMAQQAFGAAMGQPGGGIQSIGQAASEIGKMFNLSPAQTGEMERVANNSARDISNTVSNFNFESEGKAEGQSWVMALVKALGPKLNELGSKMSKLAGEATKSPEKASEFQAVSQEFNLLMTSLTGAIKTIGEAQATAARKG